MNYADEGGIARRFSTAVPRPLGRERTFLEAAAASEIAPLFLHCGNAEPQGQPAAQKRSGLSLNGSYGHNQLVSERVKP